MMNLDHTVIKSIIKDLDKSINEHIISKDLFFTNCNCDTPNQNGKCFNCRAKEVIDDLSCLKSNLEPFAKNTINSIHFIDVESFCCSLGKHNYHDMDSISIEPTFSNPIKEPDGYKIFVTISRLAMDSMGGIEGNESNTFVWEAIDKRKLGIVGIPYLLSSWVVNPDQYELAESNYPNEWMADHDSDCEMADDPELDCSCGATESGYWHPPEDFVYQEMDSILEQCNWIEAEFDSKTSEWQLGNTSFNVRQYQSNSDYADGVNEDNGKPSFDDYC